jgi:hypothetical protein
VLKAGSIVFNDRRSAIDCAGLPVSSSAGIPSEFRLSIKSEGFETRCQVIAEDRPNLEVSFRSSTPTASPD